jgi:hypothetical protein
VQQWAMNTAAINQQKASFGISRHDIIGARGLVQEDFSRESRAQE